MRVVFERVMPNASDSCLFSGSGFDDELLHDKDRSPRHCKGRIPRHRHPREDDGVDVGSSGMRA